MTNVTMSWTQAVTKEFSLPAAASDALQFRIDVFVGPQGDEARRLFRLRVWRYETVRLQPLSDTALGSVFDHTILVADDMFDPMEIVASSAEEAYDAGKARILIQCGHSGC